MISCVPLNLNYRHFRVYDPSFDMDSFLEMLSILWIVNTISMFKFCKTPFRIAIKIKTYIRFYFAEKVFTYLNLV